MKEFKLEVIKKQLEEVMYSLAEDLNVEIIRLDWNKTGMLYDIKRC